MSQRKQTDTPTEKRIEPFFIRYSNSQCTIDSQVMKQSARKLSSDVRVCSQLSSDHQYLYYLYLLVEKKNHQMKTLQKEVAYIKSNQLCLIKTRANSESKKKRVKCPRRVCARMHFDDDDHRSTKVTRSKSRIQAR